MADRKKARLGRPPATTSAETRDRIIAAARECFARFGYDKTTNQRIARRAEITSGAIYHYFESKQDLFEAVADETLRVVLDQFRRVVAGQAGVVAKISALLDAAGDLNERDPSMAAFVSASSIEVLRHAEFAPLATRQMVATSRFFEEIVAEGKERGEISSDLDTTAIVHMLMATTTGIALYAAFANGAAHRAIIGAFERLVAGTLVTERRPALTPPDRGPVVSPFRPVS